MWYISDASYSISRLFIPLITDRHTVCCVLSESNLSESCWMVKSWCFLPFFLCPHAPTHFNLLWWRLMLSTTPAALPSARWHLGRDKGCLRREPFPNNRRAPRRHQDSDGGGGVAALAREKQEAYLALAESMTESVEIEPIFPQEPGTTTTLSNPGEWRVHHCDSVVTPVCCT